MVSLTGCLLIAGIRTIEWLDDDWRQAVVSFASRFPNAFPLTDASSLNLSIAIFSPHETTLGDFQRHFGEHTEQGKLKGLKKLFRCLESAHVGNFIHLLTSHDNGSLNLWQLCLEENRLYNNILNIVHRYRMCGHRFRYFILLSPFHIGPFQNFKYLCASHIASAVNYKFVFFCGQRSDKQWRI